jgi:hypothetical protein
MNLEQVLEDGQIPVVIELHEGTCFAEIWGSERTLGRGTRSRPAPMPRSELGSLFGSDLELLSLSSRTART